MKTPIIGQEAICPDGLGRVIAFKDDFPEQWIKVSTYFHHKQREWSPDNVTLINPTTKLPETEIVKYELHGVTDRCNVPRCNKCGQVAVPCINGKCFNCDLEASKFETPQQTARINAAPDDDTVIVTCEGKSTELFRSVAIYLGLTE